MAAPPGGEVLGTEAAWMLGSSPSKTGFRGMATGCSDAIALVVGGRVEPGDACVHGRGEWE